LDALILFIVIGSAFIVARVGAILIDVRKESMKNSSFTLSIPTFENSTPIDKIVETMTGFVLDGSIGKEILKNDAPPHDDKIALREYKQLIRNQLMIDHIKNLPDEY